MNKFIYTLFNEVFHEHLGLPDSFSYNGHDYNYIKNNHENFNKRELVQILTLCKLNISNVHMHAHENKERINVALNYMLHIDQSVSDKTMNQFMEENVVSADNEHWLDLCDLFMVFKDWHRMYVNNSCCPKEDLKNFLISKNYKIIDNRVHNIKLKETDEPFDL